MQIYTLRGIEVQFPYDAYACQVCTESLLDLEAAKALTFADNVSCSCAAGLYGQGHPGPAGGVLDACHVCYALAGSLCHIAAMLQRANALLESPTGTGKTLCLLCATLAWREAQKKVRLTLRSKRNLPSTCSKTCCLLQAAPTSAMSITQPPAAGQQVQTWAEKLKEGYAELKTEGVVSLPTIVYSSRTHSQLAQVMKELRNTTYRLAIIAAHCRGIANALNMATTVQASLYCTGI